MRGEGRQNAKKTYRAQTAGTPTSILDRMGSRTTRSERAQADAFNSMQKQDEYRKSRNSQAGVPHHDKGREGAEGKKKAVILLKGRELGRTERGQPGKAS